MKALYLTAILACGLATFLPAQAEPNWTAIEQWITLQKINRSLHIEFTQTRTLPTLKRPQIHTGQLWFQAPDQVRWQLGDPPELIVLKRAEDLHTIFPIKKKAERITTSTGEDPASEFSMMLRYPIADNLTQFREIFDLIEMLETEKNLTLTLRPRDPQARKWVKQMTFLIERKHGVIERMNLQLKNGATLITQVTTAKLNSALSPTLFQYDLSSFTLTER